jgi:S-layer protein
VTITTSGADSLAAVTAGGATAVTVAGTNAVDLTGSSFGALKTLTVKGSAGVTANVSAIASVTSVDTTGTTGTSKVTIDAATAAFAGGAGADSVTLATTSSTKAVTLGAGNDTLSLFAGTTSLTATMSGGDGTDTLVMDAADAATASATVAFGGKIDGFEKLSLRAAAADQTIDLANLDNISYVISAGAAATFTETLKNLAANSTVELTTAAAGTVAATLADATGTADVLNVVLKNAAATDFGTLKAAGVETINVTATDTKTDAIDTFTLNLNAAAAKSVVVTGNANVTLTGAAADVALASLDGSAMTGKLVASTNGTVAETIKGGSAADTLTAVGNGDTLIGGAGADKLIVTGNLATLTGGAGNDTFDVSDPTSNVNSYATITDLTAGDIIKFADTAATESFKASKVVLADTAVFQDYANAAIAQTAQGEISWFQIGGNTYVIEHAQVAGTSFLNGTDVIVKITGAVDLSHSSFNAGAGQQTLVYIV